MYKKMIAALLVLSVLVSLNGCSNGGGQESSVRTETGTEGDTAAATGDNKDTAGTIVLRVGCTGAEDSNYAKGLYQFEELAEKYSEGKVDVQVFPGGQLGDERDMVEGVAMGSIEMCLTSTGPLPSISEDFMILDLPFLFDSREKATEFLDGQYGRQILDTLEPKGIRAMGFWENGFRNITSNFQITHPEDLKGFKIRTMENEVHMKTFELLGANPSPMAWSEVYSALQQNVMDGHENALVNIANYKIYEVNQHIAMTGHFYSAAVLMINQELFSGLDADIQEALVKAEEESRMWEREYSAGLDESLRREMEEKGALINDVDKAEWQKACEPTYDFFKDRINQEYLSSILGQ